MQSTAFSLFFVLQVKIEMIKTPYLISVPLKVTTASQNLLVGVSLNVVSNII